MRDLAIQRRDNDLVLATFGRGFYILDDYSPLRSISEQALAEQAVLFPVRDAAQLRPPDRRNDSRGDGFYTAPNPPYGALFTYYLREAWRPSRSSASTPRRRRERRRGSRSPAVEAELRAEDEEVDPQVLLIVRDADGAVVRRVIGDREQGLHRVTWDLRYPAQPRSTCRRPWTSRRGSSPSADPAPHPAPTR